MPIPVKIRDNSSSIKMKTSSPDNIKVQSDSSVDTNRLDYLIKEEKEERIEADANLQAQILDKQDKIKQIEIFQEDGYFDSTLLNLLISDNANKIVYQDNYYTLMYKGTQYRRYQAPSIDPNVLYTVLVDVTTGHYIYSWIPNAELQNHMSDNERHLNAGERTFWNNKINLNTDGELLEFNRN